MSRNKWFVLWGIAAILGVVLAIRPHRVTAAEPQFTNTVNKTMADCDRYKGAGTYFEARYGVCKGCIANKLWHADRSSPGGAWHCCVSPQEKPEDFFRCDLCQQTGDPCTCIKSTTQHILGWCGYGPGHEGPFCSCDPPKPQDSDGCKGLGQACTCGNTGKGGKCDVGPAKKGLYCYCGGSPVHPAPPTPPKGLFL